MSAGILPRFVTPTDVREEKNRLDPTVRALDDEVERCETIHPATREGWRRYSKGWRTFFEGEESWFHAASQMDRLEAYEREIANWQKMIGGQCRLATPRLTPPPSALDAVKDAASGTLSTTRTVAIAAAIVAVVVGLKAIVRK